MVASNWKPPIPLNGHIYSYGRTDSGKTWKLVAVLQFYHKHGYKIWDLWGGKRKEGGFWCFPSDELFLWEEYQKEVGEMKSPGPKQYNVTLLYPLFYDSLPDRLPEKKPDITAKPFTLYFKDIGVDEISTITGALSKQAQHIWKQIVKKLPDSANGEDILEWFESKQNTQFKRGTLYNSFIKPFCDSKILMGKDYAYNLVIKHHATDKNTISVLMDDYIPEEYKMFFILHILKNVYEMGEKDVIHRKHIAFFRELNYFMKVQDESAQDAEQKQIMRNHFSNIARYGRSVVLIAGDTQSPNEVKGIVDGQDDLLLINELPGAKDREFVCDRLISDGKMSSRQRDYLGSVQMTREKMVVVGRGEYAKLIKRVQPPRTKCFKRIDGSFNKFWTRIYNSWKEDVIEYKSKVADDYHVRKMDIKIRKEQGTDMEDEIVAIKTDMGEDISNIDEEIEEFKEDKKNKLRYKELINKQMEEELEQQDVI